MIIVLLLIAKTCKQLKPQFISEWISALLYIHTMECYSLVKRNELFTYVTESYQSPSNYIQ